jgi:hypothetical protein
MKSMLAALLAISLPTIASAQATAPIVATPLPPAGQQAAPAGPSAPPAAPTPAPQQTPTAWLPQGNAVLQVLDKVNAQSTVVTVKVGQSTKVGSLTIQVQACSIHPPDQVPDATAFLSITNGHSDAPNFTGWMLAGNPSLSMLQDAIYDVRVVGCKA